MGRLTPLKYDDYFWTNSDSVRCLGVKRFISELLLNSVSDYYNVFSIYIRGMLQYTKKTYYASTWRAPVLMKKSLF